MKKIYIGADESYDVQEGGVFIMSFFIVGEEVYSKLSEYINKILISKKMSEIKYRILSDKTREGLLKNINRLDCKVLYYKENISKDFELLKHHKKSITLLNEYIILENIKSKINHLDIKIDNISGKKFHSECIKIMQNNLKNLSIKSTIKYSNSEKSILIQCADIFAAELRLQHKSKTFKFLDKNKCLLLS